MPVTQAMRDKRLDALREEYRRETNHATGNAQRFAERGEMDLVSEWSTRAERKREALLALDRAIKIVDGSAAIAAAEERGT